MAVLAARQAPEERVARAAPNQAFRTLVAVAEPESTAPVAAMGARVAARALRTAPQAAGAAGVTSQRYPRRRPPFRALTSSHPTMSLAEIDSAASGRLSHPAALLMAGQWAVESVERLAASEAAAELDM